MKIIISPTKTMRITLNKDYSFSYPTFKEEANKLFEYLKSLTKEELNKIYEISPKLLDETYLLLHDERTNNNLGQALFSYQGLQFQNMKLDTLTKEDISFLNDNLYILSGLYGILKPLDLIHFYRLEMKSKINFKSYHSLYDYYENKVFNVLNNELIISLASNEYNDLIKKSLKNKIIKIEFYIYKDNKYKINGTYSKIERGKMINFIAKNKILNLEDIKKFNEDNFVYSKELSNDSLLAFIKKEEV